VVYEVVERRGKRGFVKSKSKKGKKKKKGVEERVQGKG
jgi:hypothetical protein